MSAELQSSHESSSSSIEEYAVPATTILEDVLESESSALTWQMLLDKLTTTSGTSQFGQIHGQTPRAVLIRLTLKDYTIAESCVAASVFLTREDTFEMYQAGTYPEKMSVVMLSYFESSSANGYVGDAMRECAPVNVATAHIRQSYEDQPSQVTLIPLLTSSSIVGILLIAMKEPIELSHPLQKIYILHAKQFAQTLYQDQLERRIRVVETELGQTVAARTLAITRSKRELQSILDAIQAGIIIVDEKQETIVSINPSALAMMQCDDIDIIGRSINELFLPNPLSSLLSHSDYERLRCPNGRILYVARRSARIRSNQQWLHIVSFVDMSEQVSAEQKLHEANSLLEKRVQDRTNELQKTVHQLQNEVQQRQEIQLALALNERFLNLIFESISIGVCLNDAKGKYMRVNKAFLALHGYSEEELLQKDYRIFLRGTEEERIRSIFRTFMHDEQAATVECEFQLHGKFGNIRHVHVTASKFQVDGRTLIVSGVHDISDRKRAEEEIREAFEREKELGELKSRFITLVSHEFRTPLTTIYSSAQLLEKNRSRWSIEKQSAYLNDIATCVMRLRDILNDILHFSKAESGKLKLTPTLVNVWDTCTEITDALIIGKGHTRIKLHIEGEKTAFVDRSIFRHIMQNLLSNGLKYSPAHLQVDCIILVGTIAMDITVRDRGIGIPESELDNLFQPFFRAANVGDINGTGMGLSLVHQMVQTHGGTISVESIQNQGTTFRVHLPFLA